jgi:hypothetical protein
MQSDNTSKIAHSRRVYYGGNLMVSRRYCRRWEMIAQTSVMAFCVFTVSICALFSTDPKNKSLKIISANNFLFSLGRGGGGVAGTHSAYNGCRKQSITYITKCLIAAKMEIPNLLSKARRKDDIEFQSCSSHPKELDSLIPKIQSKLPCIREQKSA